MKEMKMLVLKLRLRLELDTDGKLLEGSDFEEFRNKFMDALENRLGQIILRTKDGHIKEILSIDRAFILEMYQKVEEVKK